MKLVTVNDTSRSSAQSKCEKKIIYSLSWHPTETKVAMTTVNGNLMIYEALKAKMVSYITPIEGHASYKVAWNQLNPKYLLMSSARNAAIIV
jgi:hypothetical protein